MKLTNEQVEAIRTSETPQKLLAKMYGVSKSCIKSITSGRRRNTGHIYITRKKRIMKISDEQVEEIRTSETPQKLLAEIYGVSVIYIKSIQSGRRRNPYHIYSPVRKDRHRVLTKEQVQEIKELKITNPIHIPTKRTTNDDRRLTKEQIQSIKDSMVPAIYLAESYGISEDEIYKIRVGRPRKPQTQKEELQ